MADVFFNRTITIFNCYEDDLMGDETWYPTVLNDVRVLETQGANISNSGIVEANSCSIHISTESLPKQYLDPVAWSKSSDKNLAFTLRKDKDFIVIGDVSTATQTGNFFEKMKSEHDGVYRVITVDKYDIIPHLEVGGR